MKELKKNELKYVNGGGQNVGDDAADWLTIAGGLVSLAQGNITGVVMAVGSLAMTNETHDYGTHQLNPDRLYM